MSSFDAKAELHDYLGGAREALLWKLEDLSEYDIRRPLTPTGTNLLGLVKHSTATHLGYFGEVFGRTAEGHGPRFSDSAGPAAEFWATPEQTRTDIVDGYRQAWTFSDATIDELPWTPSGTSGGGGTIPSPSIAWWSTSLPTLNVTQDTQTSSAS